MIVKVHLKNNYVGVFLNKKATMEKKLEVYGDNVIDQQFLR